MRSAASCRLRHSALSPIEERCSPTEDTSASPGWAERRKCLALILLFCRWRRCPPFVRAELAQGSAMHVLGWTEGCELPWPNPFAYHCRLADIAVLAKHLQS